MRRFEVKKKATEHFYLSMRDCVTLEMLEHFTSASLLSQLDFLFQGSRFSPFWCVLIGAYETGS